MRKTRRRKPLTFGGLVAAAHERWGRRRAKSILRFAIYARLVKFKEPSRFVVSSTAQAGLKMERVNSLG